MGKPNLRSLRARLDAALRRPQLLAFLPAVSLGAFWLGGEGALVLVALGLPLLIALTGGSADDARVAVPDSMVFTPPERLEALVAELLQEAGERQGRTAYFAVALDDPDAISKSHGIEVAETAVRRVADRLAGALRPGDIVLRVEKGRFAVILAPVPRLTLDTALALARRLQTVAEEPLLVDGTTLYPSCSVGFALSRGGPDENAAEVCARADLALDEARCHGPGSVRAWSATRASPADPIGSSGADATAVQTIRAPGRGSAEHEINTTELEAALAENRVLPWFQPQLSTDTGAITGFEALARWLHPELGPIPSAEFLPLIDRAGLQERLGETMLSGALRALRTWDRAGLEIPGVGVNVSDAELRNPRLADRLAWELDRHEIAAPRLAVEVPALVLKTPLDEATARNIKALADMGCRIDLDDFGTEQASLSALRSISVSRLKIDRSLVARCDRDPDQQRRITAVLGTAERLGIATLGKGVETPGEHAMLAQLGCDHVQGFAIGRPMPMADCAEWVAAHRAARPAPPKIGRETG